MGEKLSTMQPAGLAEVIDRKVIAARAVDVVTLAFKALPDTAEGIAEFFRDNNIRGAHHAHNCPLAAYLNARLVAGGLSHLQANVSSYRVNVYSPTLSDLVAYWIQPSTACPLAGCITCESANYQYTIPPAASQFVEDFDGGKFPYLEASPNASMVIMDDELVPA